jgi:hypothetical protein
MTQPSTRQMKTAGARSGLRRDPVDQSSLTPSILTPSIFCFTQKLLLYLLKTQAVLKTIIEESLNRLLSSG